MIENETIKATPNQMEPKVTDMSDLVSRSQLLKAFNNKNIQITFDLPVEEVLGEDVDLDGFTTLVQDAIQTYKKMVIDTIKNIPTAYDPDKVVEELEEMIHPKQLYFCKYARGGCKHLDNDDKDCMECVVENAIEIAKQGGATKNCSNCANYTEPDEVDNGCYLCCKGYEDNYEPKVK